MSIESIAKSAVASVDSLRTAIARVPHAVSKANATPAPDFAATMRNLSLNFKTAAQTSMLPKMPDLTQALGPLGKRHKDANPTESILSSYSAAE